MHAQKPGNLPNWPPPQPEGGPEAVSPPTAASTSSGSDDTAIAAPVEQTPAEAQQQHQHQHTQPQGLRSFDFGSWSPSDANSPASYRPPAAGLASPAFPQFEPPHHHHQPPQPQSRQQHPFTSYQAEPLPIEQPSSWPSPGFFSAERQSLQHANNGYHGVSLSMLEMGGGLPSAASSSSSAAPRSGSGAAATSFGLPSSAPNPSSSYMLVDEPAPLYDPWRSTASTSTSTHPHPHQPRPPPPQHLHSPDQGTTSPRATKRSRNESDTSASSISALNALTSAGALGEYPLFGGQAFGGIAQQPGAWQPQQQQQGNGASTLHRADRSLSGASGSGSGTGSGSGSGSGENGSASGGVASSRTSLSVGGDGGSRPSKGSAGAAGASASASGLAGSIGAAAVDDKKIVQRADKSCKKCRERRVRCDRAWPACARCQKRREACEWTDVTNVDEVEEGGDAEQISQLQAKVAALERQLKTTSFGGQGDGGDASNSNNSGSHSGHKASPSAAGGSQRAISDSFVNARASFSSYPMDSAAASIPGAVQDIWTKMLQLGQDEGDVVARFVAQQTGANMDLGRGNVHWRIGQVEMARYLTCHLMDAALYACCSKLPGIKPLAERIGFYKTHLDTLDPAQQCAVAVLCALGARASPHSQLLGVSSIHLSDGTPSPPAYLYAGERRELACRQLEARARELCWSHNFFQETEISMLDGMVGLVQLLIYEEVLPRQSRFFARNAIGMYFDIRHDALERGERTSKDPRIGPGCALFLADAIISSASSRPSYITTGELDQYIVTDGVQIPDFPNADLGDELRKCTQRPLTVDKLVDALTTSCLWVCGCSRLFAQLSTGRRQNAPSTLPLLKSLWKLIDKVHNAIQELQQLLVGLACNQVAGCEDQPFGLEHFVLLGVRYDSLLVDLINLQHVYLMKNRDGPGTWAEREDDPLLTSMRQESELRVRKCLKLASFYAQLYLQSQDKHLVHHMLMELEMLPEWTTWAAQRVGQPGGPTTEEYEVSVDELDWFQQALELSSYYTPKAAHRLQALSQARKRFQSREVETVEEQLRNAPNPLPSSALPGVDHVSGQRAAIESHEADNPHYHYDLPPNSRASFAALAPPDDPQHMFHVSSDNAQLPSPSQLYIFDTYGVASSQGQALMDQQPVPSLDFVQERFDGRDKWAELGVRDGQQALEGQYSAVGEGPERERGRSDEWMRSAGRSTGKRGESEWKGD
ncbi:hypothetical protein JCM9279_004706 [Rhodotorula babjevae]